MNCKNCGVEINENKHGVRKKFCCDKCRSYYNFHNIGSRSGDIFRQIENKSKLKIK
jgi:hypothetical protein